MIALPKCPDINSNVLDRMLTDGLTTSYKLFWFLGVFKEVVSGEKVIPFRRVVCRMISDSWYPLVEYHLNFGVVDKLYDLVMLIHRKYKIESSVREDDLLEFLESLEDPEVEKCISDLYKMVPYRLVSLFFAEELAGLKDYKKNFLIESLSQSNGDSLYRIDSKNKTVSINEQWSEYLRANQNIVYGWIKYKLIYFLQSRNPNVPAIPYKLSAPLKRDLSAARKLWQSMSQQSTVCDIYTGAELNPENYGKYGSLSIDHFIPWSFVMHDELWNLTPTFATVNSSKNNKLPVLDSYIDSFCKIQYETYRFILRSVKLKKQLEDYLHLSKNMDLSKGIDRQNFSNSIKSAVTPLFQIAYNQGYGLWNAGL